MKVAEINQKTDKELDVVMADTRKRLEELAVDMRTKQVPNVKQTLKLRKTVARILTIRQQRRTKEASNG